MNKTYIIAEIGLNYAYGNENSLFLDNALKLIDIAVVAGCDAVKFQKRSPEICVPTEQKNKEKIVPWRISPTTYLQYKQDIEFGKFEYDTIDKYCKEKKIHWSASPWDLQSAKFLKHYNLPWVKIASAIITNLELVEYCAKNFNHVIISTGMSTEEEIIKCYKAVERFCHNIVIMHCNSSYPAHTKDLNLSYLKQLHINFPKNKIGYSGHEFGLTTTMASIYLGAEYIERHITLSRDNWGSDQLASVEPQGLFKLVKGIRDLELAYGNGIKNITDEEHQKRKILRK